MAEVIQRVRTVFTASGSGLQREVSSISSQLRRLQQVALGVAGGYGIGRLFKGLLDVSAAAEGSALGIATMIQAADRMRGRITPFSSALGIAKGTLEDLRQVAVDTPATFEQVAQSFKAIVFPGRAAGLDMKRIAQLAGDVATLESAEGTPGLIARDIQQMMRGTNNVDSQFLRPFKDELLGLIRQGRQGAALARLQEIIQLDPQARKAFGESFEGRLATFKDQIDAVKRAAGAPIFAAANGALGKMSDWLTKNRTEVERIAASVGRGLVAAFRAVADVVRWLIDSGVGKFALYVYGGIKAVGLLAGGFRLLVPILGGLAASPLWAVIAGAALSVAAIVKGIRGWQEFTAQRELADSNRASFGRVGGFMASTGNMLGMMLSGNWEGAQTMAREAGRATGESTAAVEARQNAKIREQWQQGVAQWRTQGHMARAKQGTDAVQRALDAALEARFTKAPRFEVDARGSKVTLNTRLETDDPARFADASLKAAFIGTIARPMAASMMLGGATGGVR